MQVEPQLYSDLQHRLLSAPPMPLLSVNKVTVPADGLLDAMKDLSLQGETSDVSLCLITDTHRETETTDTDSDPIVRLPAHRFVLSLRSVLSSNM